MSIVELGDTKMVYFTNDIPLVVLSDYERAVSFGPHPFSNGRCPLFSGFG